MIDVAWAWSRVGGHARVIVKRWRCRALFTVAWRCGEATAGFRAGLTGR